MCSSFHATLLSWKCLGTVETASMVWNKIGPKYLLDQVENEMDLFYFWLKEPVILCIGPLVCQ